ncbi:ImmA/IrrE family metallo-endopeptidase [Brevundimonas sp.]|uniref:ImmA/IrrE family metallo-endopeptidase n=1 Tax=Brevundimonas sp. TaxID=1871086 RepID=UPI00390CA649
MLTDPDKSQGIILCRPGVPGGRRRFTIGHELGHFLIPTHVGNQRCTQAHLSERGFSTPAQRREAEANRFAAGILMPKPWFERDADRLGLPEVGHLRKLARSYDVSLEAAANRFVELTSTPCAVVFSYDGVVRYARSHVSFPRLAVERKSRLPRMGKVGRVSVQEPLGFQVARRQGMTARNVVPPMVPLSAIRLKILKRQDFNSSTKRVSARPSG